MLGNRNFGFSGNGGSGGGGGTIGGGGTLNYVAMFSPDGTHIANAPIKIGDAVTRSYPANTGQDSVAIGYDSTVTGEDNYTVGYGINFNGSGGFIIGFNQTIDDTSTTYGSGRIFSLGSDFTITGGQYCDAIINLSMASSITATSETRGVYLFGDSHICNDFVTYSTLIGESCNFTRVDHTTAIGIFTNITDSAYIYTFGEGSSFTDSNTITNFGSYNAISSSTNLGVFGNGNTITDSNKLYIGNNNNNMVIDGITGYVGIGTVTPLYDLHIVSDADASTTQKIHNTSNQSFAAATLEFENNLGNQAWISVVGEYYGFGWFDNSAIIGDLTLNSEQDIVFLTGNTAGLPRANFEKARITDAGDFAVGVIAPLARFHNFGVNASGINQRLEPIAGVIEDVSGATINTTDATITTLQTIAIPTDTVYMIEARITCRKTAGAGVGTIGNGNGYIRVACYANIGGVVTISGVVQSSFTGEGIGAFNATLTISGTNVLVRVTGAANDDVTWNTITRIERVG